ncbi:hypothetical protein BCR33DRAFT_714188 [Rhizoclosmatium globosum]|uniref:DUF4614 domain-containing protein n=1 Tax=Rhizoclosmatium globosum TaxID=329046 RepID=A0A1Y2CQB9_9FUNG|nr:hypothetical protein BCR33DRAFT_714188 [Rhizoclosmatium globosum]|eukprot:ORY49136.1 hypothetical protein BCR33DRAFT_714188 [Rhizoclosmatium globosum]
MNHPRTDSASQALEKANALLHRAAAHSKSNSSSPTRTQLDPKSTTKTKPSKSKKFDWEDDSDGGSDDSSLFGPSDSDPDSDEAELKKYLSNLAKKKAADEKASGKQNNTSVTAKSVSASSSYLKKPPLATATTPPPTNDVKPIKEQYLNSIPSTPARQSSVSKLDSSQVLKPRVADNVGNISALNTKIERLNADMDAAKSALGNNLGDLESEVESIEKSPKRSGAVSSPLKGNIENRRKEEEDDDDVSSISDLNTSEMETRSSLTGRGGGAARNLAKRSYLKEKKGGFGSDSDESVVEVKKAGYGRSSSVGTRLVVDVGKKGVEKESGGETKSTPVLSTPAPTPVVVAASLQTKPKLQVPQQTTHTAATTTVSEITEDIDAPTDSSIAEEIEDESGDESRSKFNDLLTIEDLGPQTKPKPTLSQSYSTPPPPPKHQSVPTQAAQTPQQYNEQSQHQPTQQQQYTQIPPSQPTYQYPFYPPPPNQSAPPQIPPQAPPPHPYQFPPYGYGYAYPPPSPYTPMYPVYPPQHHAHYAPPPSAWMGSSGGATTFVNPYLFRRESSGSSGEDRKERSDRKGLRRCDHSCGCLPVMEAKETGERRREGKKERRRRGEREKEEGKSGEGRSQEEEDVSSYGWTSSSEDVRGGKRETKEGLRGNLSGKESDGGREFWKDTISPLMQNFEAGHASLMASFAPSTLAVNALLQNHLSMIQQYVVMNEKLLQEEVYHTQEYITLRSTKDEIKQRRRESARERDAFEQAVKEAADTLSYND